ncbi:hypothetical protein HPB47_016253, partial [Ixodes persulcatus]
DTRLREAGAEAVYCLTRGAPKGPNVPRAQLNRKDPLFPGHGTGTRAGLCKDNRSLQQSKAIQPCSTRSWCFGATRFWGRFTSAGISNCYTDKQYDIEISGVGELLSGPLRERKPLPRGREESHELCRRYGQHLFTMTDRDHDQRLPMDDDECLGIMWSLQQQRTQFLLLEERIQVAETEADELEEKLVATNFTVAALLPEKWTTIPRVRVVYVRSGRYSVILLALVDQRYLFLYISVVTPGRCHDARVYRRSPLAHLLEQNQTAVPRVMDGTEIPPLVLCPTLPERPDIQACPAMEALLLQLRRLALLVSTSHSAATPPRLLVGRPPRPVLRYPPPPPPTSELVGALTSALRAAFPEIRPRRPHFTLLAQPIADPTDDDEEDLLFGGFSSTQDLPGRYRARVPDPESDDSDTELETSPERDRGHYPRHVKPRRSPTGTRGQRLFTTTDPPTRRDFRNALVFVDRASRSSRFFGTCDVVELQLLENFLAV